MPNTLAYGVLIAWPIVVLVLFARLPASKALIWSLLGAWLLLPVRTAFDFPGLPPLDKVSIPVLSTLLAAGGYLGLRCYNLPKSTWLRCLLGVFLFSPVLTVIGNRDPIVLATQTIPGLLAYDAVATVFGQLVAIAPFVLGYHMLADEKGHRRLLLALMMAMIVYAIPILFELRFSPQLHNIVYGFFPHQFAQQVRGGGFRAVVFMGHGLLVAIFCAMALLASVYWARKGRKLFGVSCAVVSGAIFVVLIFSKSWGAIGLGIFAATGLLALRAKRVALLCGVIGVLVLTYPLLRGAGLVPVNAITQFVGGINKDRAGSFETRVVNEEALLEKAAARPIFGWGSWGRNRIYAGYNDGDTSITDGVWIITIGTFGWVGYLATFGILAYPLISTLLTKRIRLGLSDASVTLLMILALNLLDLIPNSSLVPMTWLIAGALAGRIGQLRRRPSTKRPPHLHLEEATPA